MRNSLQLSLWINAWIPDQAFDIPAQTAHAQPLSRSVKFDFLISRPAMFAILTVNDDRVCFVWYLHTSYLTYLALSDSIYMYKKENKTCAIGSVFLFSLCPQSSVGNKDLEMSETTFRNLLNEFCDQSLIAFFCHPRCQIIWPFLHCTGIRHSWEAMYRYKT